MPAFTTATQNEEGMKLKSSSNPVGCHAFPESSSPSDESSSFMLWSSNHTGAEEDPADEDGPDGVAPLLVVTCEAGLFFTLCAIFFWSSN